MQPSISLTHVPLIGYFIQQRSLWQQEPFFDERNLSIMGQNKAALKQIRFFF